MQQVVGVVKGVLTTDDAYLVEDSERLVMLTLLYNTLHDDDV